MPVQHDLEHGGRWTRLELGGRDWLWHRPGTDRHAVVPGDDFVDAGGLEECVPTVRGRPDHGVVWSRSWSPGACGSAYVEVEDFRLERTVVERPDAVLASYRLTAGPGFRFIWAAHALLDLSDAARLEVVDGREVRLFPEAADLMDRPWPAGAAYVAVAWPGCAGLRLDQLGPSDGTAVGAIVTDVDSALVIDGADSLAMRLRAPGMPTSLALWRNLGGYPVDEPYRSVGVEPMLGRVFDLDDAQAGDAVTVPASGVVAWELELTGY